MSDGAGRAWGVRRVAWFLLVVVAALVTPTRDAFTLIVVWLAGVAFFEVGYLIYRRRRGGP